MEKNTEPHRAISGDFEPRNFGKPRSCAEPRNYVEHLCGLAQARSGDVALVVATEHAGVAVDTPITYGELDRRVRALAAELQRKFLPQDRALILLDNDDHYVVAFFACLYAGLIAVPVFPPESARRQHLARLIGIAGDAGARCILSSGDMLDLVGPAMHEFGDAQVIAVDEMDKAGAHNWQTHFPCDGDIAFLQYTSGSTSAPKGVMVSHGNLMANERAMNRAMSTSADDVFVSWLPLFHDMGLIGGLLQPIYLGCRVVLMTPQFFLQRPARWLEAISRHRGTVSGGPDFAYRLCNERIKEARITGLDLASWRVAFSGAEPVQHGTLKSFISRFSPAGFQAAAVNPCYGLAEATLMVSACKRGSGITAGSFGEQGLQRGTVEPVTEGRTLVACGAVVEEHRVSIRDAHTGEVCVDGSVGEIWVSGSSIAQGYWNRPEQSAETFVERDGARWLKTGDLGFIHREQVYVAGRAKDLIIVRGHNIYPQDIEAAVEGAVDSVRKGRVAAFAIEGLEGTGKETGEGIGIAAEISRGVQKRVAARELVNALAEAASEACGEPLSVVVLLNPGGLPRTSSGKLQRNSCRRGWQDKSLDAYAICEKGQFVLGGDDSADDRNPASESGHRERPLAQLETELAHLWAESLGDNAAGAMNFNTHFFSTGGNSLTATRIAAAIESHWGITFSPRVLFEHPHLGACAAEIHRRQSDGIHARAEAIPLLPEEQRGKPQPLSPAQKQQWFLWKLDPASSAYHICGALHLTGKLNADAMTEAVSRLAQRHESLRTVFVENPSGHPQQQVKPRSQLSLRFVDLTGSPDARTDDLLQQLNREPFDLSHGPLARMTLIRLENDRHVLAMVMHHIIADGVSAQILLDELAILYRAALESTEPELPQPPIQYTDYASWQRERQGGDVLKRQLNYWCEQLGSEHAPLLLPSDHPRGTSEEAYTAAQHDFQIPDELLVSLRRMAEKSGATLFMLLLAGLQALLHRYTGQRDIRIGVPVANRSHTQLQKLVGLLVNTLVLRGMTEGRASLQELLHSVRETALGAQENLELPFEQLVETLQPDRSADHNPLFQVMFNHLREDYSAFSQGTGLVAEEQPLPAGHAQFELALDTREDASGQLRATFTYAAELFEPATIERMANHYLLLLEALADRPESALGDVNLLGEAERKQLHHWSVNERRYPNVEPVHRLVERRVHSSPDATALIFGSDKWSYAELNCHANRVAHHLIERDVKPEVKVGVALHRSPEMVVALLAILKAGGAYVPLEPEYPRERLAYMIEDSEITLLLTQSGARERLPQSEDLSILDMDTLDLRHQPETDPEVSVHGENLAYVIYTSGSTGRPKGAANRHAALHNRLLWMQEAYELNTSDKVLQKTPFGFDVSVWEFFWPLMVGAQLVVAPPGDHRDPARLVELIDGQGITTVHFVPSMLLAFLERDDIETCVSLRNIVCSGEALPPQAREAVFARLPNAALHNLYGPTEAAIDVTHWTCRHSDKSQVPIGRPISGLSAHVLDEQLNPLPPGIAGELYLGGVGLARGYLRRAGQTAERFVADPMSRSGERLYRTGDLARWNGEGQLEYLGRIDHQVKIRGLRIELGEIEAQLLAQPSVREAVVVARDNRLVAYVSARAGQRIDAAQLRERLGQVLPDYMVPGVIAELETLPLNANGKVDRKALPEVEAPRCVEWQPPQGQREETLAKIWTDVLGVERIGRGDNFFELGGHSLLAAMLASRVGSVMGRDLALRKVFEYPTLRRQAEHLRFLPPARETGLPPLEVVSRQGPMPLSPAQQRLWLVERMASATDIPAYNMVAALDLNGSLDLAILQTVLDTIVARHQALRTVYPEDDDGRPVALIRAAERLDLAVIDLSGEPATGEDQPRRVIEDALTEEATRRFDLARGPLLRARLLRFEAERHALLLCVHHIAFDGWSEAVFVNEFVTLYKALRAGETAALPTPAIQYADYAVWQSRRLESSAQRDANFWQNYLDGAPALSTLPADYPRKARASSAGAAVDIQIPGSVSESVERLARAHNSSAFTVLLATFTALLHRRAGVDDLVIGTDLAGRDHPQLENLIGFFVNVVPLRSQLKADLPFSRWLEDSRESSLSAFEYRHVPFDRVVKQAGVPRSRGGNPLVQVLFVMQNTPRSHFEIPGLEIEVVPAPISAAKFDIAVFVNEAPGGLSVQWVYATDLYRRETIERFASDWSQLLQGAIARPGATLGELMPPATDMPLSPQAGIPSPPSAGKVRTSFLEPGKTFPLVIEGADMDMDAIDWAQKHRSFIETALREHAGILFRNFGLETPQQFEAFAEAMEPSLHGSYGDLPKKEGGRNIYRSTPYPERQMILYHNESSHLERWPRKQWFFCELPSRIGGATPIVDCREMLRRLPPDLVEEFEHRELLYVRTFVPGLDVSWQDFFKTDKRAEVEARLAAAGIGWHWLDERTLQTRTRCPAVIRHPLTGEKSFFNQVQLHHVSCLLPEVREDLLDIIGAERMPRQVYYGDGAEIEEETMAVIGRTYEQCAVRFDWRRGDVVMLDNMLAAHARDPYEEPRKIVVAMGGMHDREKLLGPRPPAQPDNEVLED